MSIASEITRRIRLTGIVAAMVLVSVTAARASLLMDFLPEPASPDTPEFIWDGSSLTTGPGSFGSGFAPPGGGTDPGAGDGEALPANQDVPGLQIVTPFVIDGPTPPGGVVNAPAGSTTFYDVTLEITAPLVTAGPPDTLYGVYVIQELSGGAFEVWSTDPIETTGDVHNPTLLLAGTIEDAAIAGILHSDTGAVLSATVTYTDGAIYDAALEQYFALGITGSFSWSLLDVDLPLSITNDLLDSFEANGTGQFSGIGNPIIPEPATLALLGSGAWLLVMRRRRRA